MFFPFTLNCPWKPQVFVSSGKEEEKYSMNLNWFCRSNEIQQWFRFENLQTPQESLGPTQDAKLTELHFIRYYPPLVQFFFLKIFQRTTVVGFGSRSWVLYLPPTQKNLFAYGIYAAFVWRMFACLTPRMGSLRQWVGGVTAGQSLLLLTGRVMKLQMVSFLFFWRKG